MRAAALVAVVAVPVLAVAGATVAAGQDAPGEVRSAGVAQRPTPSAENDAATRAKAQAMLDSFRQVVEGDGAQELDAEPAGRWGIGLGVTGLEDEDYRLTAWWTVPQPPADVAAYLRPRKVDGAKAGGFASGSSQGISATSVFYGWDGTAAYADPALFVSLQDQDGQTLVTARTSIAPRLARPGYTEVDQPVSSVDVRIEASFATGRPSRTTHRTVGEPATVRKLVTAFDALPGAPVLKMSYGVGCVAGPRVSRMVTLVFHTADGDVRAAPSTTGCDEVIVRATRDGQPTARLDGGGYRDGFMRRLHRILGLPKDRW